MCMCSYKFASARYCTLLKLMLCSLFADELGVSMTVDEYSKQLSELKTVCFPEAKLLPGTLGLILCLSHNVQSDSMIVTFRFLSCQIKTGNRIAKV